MAELSIATAICNAAKAKKPKGNVKVYGMPGSMNCNGPIILAMESGAGGMECVRASLAACSPPRLQNVPVPASQALQPHDRGA